MAETSSAWIKEVMASSARSLGAIGMRKRQGDLYSCSLEDETIGCLGLGRVVGRRSSWLRLSPTVGVRHQVLEKLVADLRAEPFHSYHPATVAQQLGHVMPSKRHAEWTFLPDGGHEGIVAGMVAAIDHYGRDFMNRLRTLKGICDAMEAGLGHPMVTEYRLPVALWMLDRQEEALRYLHDRIASYAGRGEPGVQMYRKFAEALSRRIGSGGSAA